MMPSWSLVKKIVKKSLVTCGYLGYAGCVVHCTSEYIGDVVICNGPSMEPTLFSDDIIVTEHLSVITKQVKRGDIVVSRSPSNPREFICKRVRGIPGDKVKMGFTTRVIPQGHVWLEGDNRNNSSDSRNYGPVPMGLIRSRAVYKIYPFEKIRKITNS